jgi:succinyl-diaminopimelate desuccinylase
VTELTDPLALAQALLRCPSVTPDDAGAQDVLAASLESLGFSVTRLRFGGIENLFARIGAGAPHVCFAGHTDVVPAGAGWRVPAFAGEVSDGRLYGRGACDMKGAIAAFVAAAASRIEAGPLRGSISLLITGDEEGEAENGTVRVLEWMQDAGQVPDYCLVGEPTNPARLGEVIKTGRRGSLTARLTVFGTQGHAAYPHRADNPVHRLIACLSALASATLDTGGDGFEPSSLQVTSIDVGNPAANVIPAEARATLNIRFNDRHSGASLSDWLRAEAERHCPRHALEIRIGGEPFRTRSAEFATRLRDTIAGVTGFAARFDTGGGTSDARFIARYCPVAEFGLVGATMHQTDEHVPVEDLRQLAVIYSAILKEFVS